MTTAPSGRPDHEPDGALRSSGSVDPSPGSEDRRRPATKPPARLVKLTSPLARQLAGRRWFSLWAVLHHRGRRTGRAYAIPVAVLVTPQTFLIGLPWGPQTNWARNVLAAGGCTIRWKAVDYQVTAPTLVGPETALTAANRLQRTVIRRTGLRHFLQLQRTRTPTSTGSP